jgi:hypothetical protein
MNNADLKKHNLKQKVVHELLELVWVFVYLAIFFCILTTYRMMLLGQFQEGYFEYGTALVNALIFAKIILIGEYAHLGKRHEDKPLAFVVVYKSLLFSLFVEAFRFLEDVIKHLLHGERLERIFRDLGSQGADEVLIRGLLVFACFVPFFALWEFRRLIGDAKLTELLFQRSHGGLG